MILLNVIGEVSAFNGINDIVKFFSEHKITPGSLVSIIIIASVFIDISKIKVYPLRWLGKALTRDLFAEQEKQNAEILKSIQVVRKGQANLAEKTEKEYTALEAKLDEHIAQSYRDKIMTFQDKLINEPDELYSKERWNEVINACKQYETYIDVNDLPNGLCESAIDYIREKHKECLNERRFLDVPTQKKES